MILPPTTSSHPKILVTDDEGDICELLEETLTEEGYDVTTARSAQEAMKKLEREEFDVLITDICMPGRDGLDLIEEAKKNHPTLATIVITAHADSEKFLRAIRRKVDDFLQKPFDLDEVCRSVRLGLAARRAQNEEDKTRRELHDQSERLVREKEDLSHQITEAMRKVTVFQEELLRNAEGLNTLSDVSNLVTTILDLDKLLDVCLALVNQRLRIQRSSIMLYDRASDSLRVVAARGSHIRLLGKTVPIGEGVAGHVARTREPLLVPNILEDGRFDVSRSTNYETGSFCCVPLTFQDELLGVINVNDTLSGGPFDKTHLDILSTVAKQISVAIANARLYNNLKENSVRMVEALATTLEAKDVYTCGHSERVTTYALRLGDRIGLSREQLDTLRFAGLLHDIGKIGVPEEILQKEDALTEAEWAVVAQHPIIGERIIGALHFLTDVREVIRHHHERWDGRGYPDGLPDGKIGTLPRILAIADAFDAMTSARPYRSARTTDDALAELARQAGSQFDPTLVAAFRTLFDMDEEIRSIRYEMRYPDAKSLPASSSR
ncbi:MAG: HD domain-containing phosphohydrolase [Planctomycetota bacterium]